MGSRKTWSEIRGERTYRGRWVALDECRYDSKSQPIEGSVVDHDDDLVALCNRIDDNGSRRCAILFCEDVANDSDAPPASRRASIAPPSPRRSTHVN